MLDVFISYFFRRYIDFVRHLFGQLTACDRDPGPIGKTFSLLLTGSLKPVAGLNRLNLFPFATSPDSVSSEICT